MYIFYILAMLPIVVGIILYFFDTKITWQEWLIGSVIAILTAFLGHASSYKNSTDDIQTLSGQVTQVKHIPEWTESYKYPVYSTDSKGNVRLSHYATGIEYHKEKYIAFTNLEFDITINQDTFDDLCKKFNDFQTVRGCRTTGKMASLMVKGDHNDYIADNKTGWIQPVNTTVSFTNRIKASRSVFSFIELSDIEKNNIYEYPISNNSFESKRLLGKAEKDFNIFLFDQLNARLGPDKKVNIIIIGFDSSDSMLAQYQEALWIGGKKNDVVICYGTGWSRAFGWTDNKTVLRNLESLFISEKINNDLLPKIETITTKDYQIKNWDDFNYITIFPTRSQIICYLIILSLTQIGLYVFFQKNDFEQI